MNTNKTISIFDDCCISQASASDIQSLAQYHYRKLPNQPYVKAWKIVRNSLEDQSPIGIITYSMPVLNSRGRRQAADGFFSGNDQKTRLCRLNKHVRRISRVIIDPRYRGLGLASRLVAETMPKLDVAMIETTAVMGRLSGFFERAGMRRFDLPPRPQALALARGLEAAGIDRDLWIDAAAVQERIVSLPAELNSFIEKHIHQFLGAYGRRRNMPAGTERTQFALCRLNARPAYFAWLNPKKKIKGLELHIGEINKRKKDCNETINNI